MLYQGLFAPPDPRTRDNVRGKYYIFFGRDPSHVIRVNIQEMGRNFWCHDCLLVDEEMAETQIVLFQIWIILFWNGTAFG